jgi:hypothetical protein
MKVQKSHLRLALFALGAAVLYNLWFFVLRPGPQAAARGTTDQPLLERAALLPGASVSLDPAAIPAPPDIDMSTVPVLGRDPFLFGNESRHVAFEAARPILAPDPAVRSILFSSTRRLAIVDGRIVGVGDTVGAFTVTAIEQAAVVFTTSSGERRRVSVHAPSSRGLTR